MEEKLFSIDEVSRYLKIPKSTLYKLSEKGLMPSCKIGKQLRFRKSSLDGWITEKESVSTSQTLEPGKKAKAILLIDDDNLVLKTLTRFLNARGYQTESAESGEEALEKAEKLNFDLIIADVRMAGINGIETIKKIRELNTKRNRPNIPEIIITGYMDGEAEREAGRLGNVDYVYKPFAISDFIKTVQRKME